MINMALVHLPNSIHLMSQNSINANCYQNYLDLLFSVFLSIFYGLISWHFPSCQVFLCIWTFFFHWKPPSWAPLRHFTHIISLLQGNGSNYDFPAEMQRLIHSRALFCVWQCRFHCGPSGNKMYAKCCWKTRELRASIWTQEATGALQVEWSCALSSVSHVLFGDDLTVTLGWWERIQETRHWVGIMSDRYNPELKSSDDTNQVKSTVNAKKLAANCCGQAAWLPQGCSSSEDQCYARKPRKWC